MLILQRNKDEIINIGDDIEVKVTEINESTVNISVSLTNSIIRGQSFYIGNDIEIKLLKITDKISHFGINAHKSISVWRNEVYKAIKEGRTKKQRLKNCFLVHKQAEPTYG